MRDTGNENLVPPFWETPEAIPDDAFPIVCRTVLAGHSGDGIVIADNRAELVAASLYVKYVKKRDEYRIHVGRRGGESIIISVQQKLRSREAEVVDTRVRNHDNGYIFARNNVNPPAAVIEGAKRALEASGLDFGAVDVIWNAHYGRAYVLEINTSPGLEGTTVEDYARFFQGE
jgi:D-alanine-D-alanine ligase-like ATP-grasp enzyme